MSMPATSSAALPIAYVVLRILIVLNWLFGAAILALLVVMPERAMDHGRLQALSFARGRPADHGPARDRGGRPRHDPAELRPSSNGCSRSSRRFARATRSSPRTRPVCRRSPGPCSRCSFSASSSARSPRPFRLRRIRSISMPDFRSTAGSPSCSRSCWPACSRKARTCAKTSKGRCDDGDHRQARRPTARSADDADRARGSGRNHAGQPLDPQDRQGARDPLLDARCDLRGALVPAWRHSPV